MARQTIIRSEISTPGDVVAGVDAAMRDIHEQMRRLVEDTWDKEDLWNTPLLQGITLLPAAEGLTVEPFGHLAKDARSLREGWRTPTVCYDVLDEEVLLQVEMPGLRKDDVHVEVAPGFVRIEGVRERAVRRKAKGVSMLEQVDRRYRVVVSPGAAMDPNRVSADYENGILELRVARSDAGAQRTRKIDLH